MPVKLSDGTIITAKRECKTCEQWKPIEHFSARGLICTECLMSESAKYYATEYRLSAS